MPIRYFVHLAFRGTRYRGWQRQSGEVRTVQATIEGAIARGQGRSGAAAPAEEAIRVVGCGRTDAGVHAADFYLHFDVTRSLRENWLFIMNKILPDDIVLYRVWRVDSGAHVRYDARERTYDYFIHTRPDPFLSPLSTLVGEAEIDTDAVESALAVLVGHRDFRAFCLTPDRHNTTRCDLRNATLHREAPHRLRFRFVADRFLRGMIRILVYQLLRAGRGEVGPQDFAAALASGRRMGTGQAPPQGLFLSKVTY